MKKKIFEPVSTNSNSVVHYTDTVTVDRSMGVHVPNGYSAIVFADEKVLCRIDPCSEKMLSSYGRDVLGKKCRVAFVRTKELTPLAWGFGNIQINNERLREAYRVGASGQYYIDIVSVPKLASSFAGESDITSEKLRELTFPIVRNVGTALLGGYFAGTDISVFEIASKAGEFRSRFLEVLQSEKMFRDIGLNVKDLAVNVIHVNEEDLEMIRSRINGQSNAADAVQPKKPELATAEPTDDEVEDVMDEMSALIEKERAGWDAALASDEEESDAEGYPDDEDENEEDEQ